MCIIQGCDGEPKGRGLCNKHYLQEWKADRLLNKHLRVPNEYIMEGSICKIKIYNNKGEIKGYAIIDSCNIEKCKPYKWGIDAHGYAGTSKGVRLHTFISGIVAPDHKNRNPLDNREENLRPASESQNRCNRAKQSNNTSGYKGVGWFPSKNKWRAYIQHNHKFIHIGYFDDKKEAALAYNEKALEFHGEFAVINPILIRRVNNEG